MRLPADGYAAYARFPADRCHCYVGIGKVSERRFFALTLKDVAVPNGYMRRLVVSSYLPFAS
jgi:hypothetical protein